MTTNPNHTPSPTEVVAASDEARNLYSVDTINEWRSNESLRLGWLRMESFESAANDDQYVTTFKDAIDQKLDEFLATKGIAPDDAEYDALRQLYRDSSIDRFSENEWGNSPASRGVDANDTQSQSEKTRELIHQWHDAQVDDTEVADDDERTIDTIRTELSEARELWSGMQAKRQGRLWDRRIKGYNAAKQRYEALQQELGVRTLADTTQDDTISQAQKNAAIIAYIFEEQNELRASTKEKVANTPVGKFVEKFGGWLNKGSGWSKFGKGVLVGTGAGLVGAGAGLLFGAAGMGALVAGAGAMAAKSAVRFTKSYAKSDARQGRGMETNEASVKTEWEDGFIAHSNDEAFNKALGISAENFEQSTKKEQHKRRKTTTLALGGMALGTGIGATLGFALDHSGVAGEVRGSIFDRQPPVPSEPTGTGLTEDVENKRIDDAVQETEDRLRDEYDDKIDDLNDRINDVSGDVEDIPDVPSFEFGYGTATEHLLEDVASEQLGVELKGADAYLLINHLMEATDGNVFEGITTEYHGSGNVWIMEPGGKTNGFTPEALKAAQDWLNSGRPGLPRAGV